MDPDFIQKDAGYPERMMEQNTINREMVYSGERHSNGYWPDVY
jgi:hypothetical protein